ncbi:PREDICTED: L-type lectin-domain containing receptor kinase S.4-like [Nicotiana attenuata]|uniref:L-type lectin-domain containing receptor kinase s.4 n=1 Tax=Nicotiana attenuata TaxID=49451 RepID=A0A314KXF8_NICAT|nr:PREDICTED: L-type lectin-domain containing receptor kinase S.4-like [Nicotiana attenuata]OIT33479.1 l-type lectin-domain containing receptor kinase s.4 [Nicotiana attenuata]
MMPTLRIPSGMMLFNVPIYLLLLLTLLPVSIFSFSIGLSSHFDPNLGLIGDAKITKDGSFVQLTDSSKSSLSSGFVFQRIPFKFLDSNSFSTDFSFSISPHNGDGLSFVIVPTDFPSKFSKKMFGLSNERRFFGVEFDTLLNENVGDKSANHVGVNVGSLVSAKSTNVSFINLVLNSGKKLHSWVDYECTSKRLEVRLSEFGIPRPYDPLLVYQVDLGNMWKGEEVLVGLSSSTGSSFQVTSVYSWKFRVRSVPKWLHSQPADPRKNANEQSLEKIADKKRFHLLAFLSGFIFATGCIALAAFIGLFLWVIVGNNSEVVIPAKSSVHPGDFRYEKVNVVVEDGSGHVKNKN